MRVISREIVAEKLSAHLHHELSLGSLVDWAESAIMDGEFDPTYLPTIRDVIARIGVADVRAFGLALEDSGASRWTALFFRRHLAEAFLLLRRASNSSHSSAIPDKSASSPGSLLKDIPTR